MTLHLRSAAAVAALLLCAGNARAAGPAPTVCEGMTPPRRLTTMPVELPPSYTATRLGGIVVDEALIGIDGRVSGIRAVRARIEGLAPFAQKSVELSRFDPALIEGNPVVTRVQIGTTLGTIAKAVIEPEYDMVWAHVSSGQSREARWQLAHPNAPFVSWGNTPNGLNDPLEGWPDRTPVAEQWPSVSLHAAR